jgi:hypothetical protein
MVSGKIHIYACFIFSSQNNTDTLYPREFLLSSVSVYCHKKEKNLKNSKNKQQEETIYPTAAYKP